LVAKQFDLLWRTAVCLAHVAEDCGAKIWLGAPFHQGWLMRLSEVASGNDERGAAARRLAASLQARRILPQDIAVRFVLEAWPEALVVFGVASVKELMSAIRSAATPLSDGLLAELMTSGFAGDPMAGPEPIRR
jgi:aryl-alcohol dehydrogenase-like predicted oxidoreductase